MDSSSSSFVPLLIDIGLMSGCVTIAIVLTKTTVINLEIGVTRYIPLTALFIYIIFMVFALGLYLTLSSSISKKFDIKNFHLWTSVGITAFIYFYLYMKNNDLISRTLITNPKPIPNISSNSNQSLSTYAKEKKAFNVVLINNSNIILILGIIFYMVFVGTYEAQFASIGSLFDKLEAAMRASK